MAIIRESVIRRGELFIVGATTITRLPRFSGRRDGSSLARLSHPLHKRGMRRVQGKPPLSR
jgi:hypothetical protein